VRGKSSKDHGKIHGRWDMEEHDYLYTQQSQDDRHSQVLDLCRRSGPRWNVETRSNSNSFNVERAKESCGMA
jgi:hypothetical protein